MRIGFDFDDVLCDFQKSWIKFNNENYGSNLLYEQMFDYDYTKVMGISMDEMMNRFQIMIKEGWFETFTPCKYAKEAVEELKNSGHDLYVITARDFEVLDVTKRWLNNNFPNKFSDIFLTNQISMSQGVNNTIKKSDLCKREKIDIMIDDAPHHILDFIANNLNCVMVNVPWNERFLQTEREKPSIFKRINNLKELPEFIDSL